MPLFLHEELRASKHQAPIRLDLFVSKRLPRRSRSQIQKAIAAGLIHLNGEVVKPAHPVKARDRIAIYDHCPPFSTRRPMAMELSVRHRDPALWVLYKPAGVLCHPTLGHYADTLFQGLLHRFEQEKASGALPEEAYPHLAHRLDRATSGLLAVATSGESQARLAPQFSSHRAGRRYLALVWGDVAGEGHTVELHIGRRPHGEEGWAVYPHGDQGKPAVTHLRVLERFGLATLLECQLETGRTHQIRLHAKALGHPVLGDAKYGGEELPEAFVDDPRAQRLLEAMADAPGHGLHGYRLELEHPSTGQLLSFEEPWPDGWAAVSSLLRK